MKKLAILFTIACLTIAPTAFAQDWQPAGDQWIEKWWALELVTNTGGFNASAEQDYLSTGTNDDYNNYSVSTRHGAGLTGQGAVYLPDNGGTLVWSVVDLNTNVTNNMSLAFGPNALNNFTWHGILLILSPDERTTTMYPAHDDYAQIWLNGTKVYDNPTWTQGHRNVSTPTEIKLIQGENFLHYKCGEGTGGDYVNLRFDEADTDLQIAPTLDGQFLSVLTPVEPRNKVTTTWADIKRK